MRWVRAHKLLIVIYSTALVLAGFELTAEPTGDRRVAEFLEPEYNVADVSAEVYPDRALSLYYRAQQAAYCDEPDAMKYSVCRKRGRPKPGEIRKLLEAALATGNRSIEEAMYNYAWVLVQENAPSEQIDAAVEAWRRAHPGANRPDPRTLSSPSR